MGGGFMKIKISKRLVSTALACLMICAMLPVTAFAASKTVTSTHSSKIKLTVSNTEPEVGEVVTIRFQDTHYEDSSVIPFTFNYWCTMPEKYEIYLNGELYHTVDLKAEYDKNIWQSYLALKDKEYSVDFTYEEPVEITFKAIYCRTVYLSTNGTLLNNAYGYWSNVTSYSTRPITVAAVEKEHIHADGDGDGFCDECGYDMRIFSVTVPASMPLVMDENGAVFAADNAAIINNSNVAVSVVDVELSSENGWTIVPYVTNMADVNVDSQQIGFTVNGAETIDSGESETLEVGGGWTVDKNASLPLHYGAVASAVSEPINEQVLTLIFVLDWAN